MDRGAWQATIHGITKSQTRLSNISFLFFSFMVSLKLKDVSRILMSESFTYFNCSWFCCFCKDGLVREVGLSAHLE